MCGRFTQQRPPSEIARIFQADGTEDGLTGERYNVAPTDSVTVVLERDGRRVVEDQRWGLVPAWASSASGAAQLINARAETVHVTPAFRTAFARRRCIVPADAFYEWQRRSGGKQPYAIRRRDGQPMALAGLWSVWRDSSSGEWVRTCAIVTTAASPSIAVLHDRMPVILPPAIWGAWLDPILTGWADLRTFLRPAPDDLLTMHPVSSMVNNPRHEGPRLVEEAGPPARAPQVRQGRLWGSLLDR
ncbi:SOS response-associated peptidase [soil metagenome]